MYINIPLTYFQPMYVSIYSFNYRVSTNFSGESKLTFCNSYLPNLQNKIHHTFRKLHSLFFFLSLFLLLKEEK